MKKKKKKVEIPFTIGDKISVTGSVVVKTFMHSKDRRAILTEFDKPKNVFFVGATRKIVGKYIPGSSGYDMNSGESYNDPGFIKDPESIVVFRCRERIFGREFLVLPSQVEFFNMEEDEEDDESPSISLPEGMTFQ